MAELIQAIFSNFGAVFRHLVPSVMLLAAVASAQPNWLAQFEWWSDLKVVVVAILALVVGNIWYLLHRYGFQQLIEKIFIFPRRISLKEAKEAKYHNWLVQHIIEKHRCQKICPELFGYLHLRQAHVVLLYMVSQLLIICGLVGLFCEDPEGILKYRCWCLFAGLAFFITGFWQHRITFDTDAEATKAGMEELPAKKDPA